MILLRTLVPIFSVHPTLSSYHNVTTHNEVSLAKIILKRRKLLKTHGLQCTLSTKRIWWPLIVLFCLFACLFICLFVCLFWILLSGVFAFLTKMYVHLNACQVKFYKNWAWEYFGREFPFLQKHDSQNIVSTRAQPYGTGHFHPRAIHSRTDPICRQVMTDHLHNTHAFTVDLLIWTSHFVPES